MIDIPYDILLLAFELKKGEPLTEQQEAICEECVSGRWLEMMKVSLSDPNLCKYVMLYEKLRNKAFPDSIKTALALSPNNPSRATGDSL